jgi:hypothetical protein
VSKIPSLDNAVITRKGLALPADAGQAEVRKEESKEPSLPPTKEPSHEGAKEGRLRPWHQPGQDEWKKSNYDMPIRVQTKLKEMKNWGRIPSVYKFVAEAVEKEIDKVIAKAEKEGY